MSIKVEKSAKKIVIEGVEDYRLAKSAFFVLEDITERQPNPSVLNQNLLAFVRRMKKELE